LLAPAEVVLRHAVDELDSIHDSFNDLRSQYRRFLKGIGIEPPDEDSPLDQALSPGSEGVVYDGGQ
jgi:hypothetical protein